MHWASIDVSDNGRWIEAAGHVLQRRRIPCCPTCQTDLRVYLFRSKSEAPDGLFRGGLWIWCGNCGRHEHSSVYVPAWWVDVPGIDVECLSDPPEYLESIWPTIEEVVRSQFKASDSV